MFFPLSCFRPKRQGPRRKRFIRCCGSCVRLGRITSALLDVYKRQVSERYALIEPGRTSYHTLFEDAKDVDGIKIFTMYLTGTATDALRKLCDNARDKAPASVTAVIGEAEGKTCLLYTSPTCFTTSWANVFRPSCGTYISGLPRERTR